MEALKRTYHREVVASMLDQCCCFSGLATPAIFKEHGLAELPSVRSLSLGWSTECCTLCAAQGSGLFCASDAMTRYYLSLGREPASRTLVVCERSLRLFLAWCADARELYVTVFHVLRLASSHHAVWDVVYHLVWRRYLAPRGSEQIAFLRGPAV
jgi:hypothetical protein